MQITETLALADLTAVISITIAAIVAITGYRNTKHPVQRTTVARAGGNAVRYRFGRLC